MKNKYMLLGLTVLLGTGLVVGAHAAKETITIKGSTTVLPVAQSCAEAFMNKHADIDINGQIVVGKFIDIERPPFPSVLDCGSNRYNDNST